MASGLSQEIRCPVCWNDLRDPVCLSCEHFYCRVCITEHMNKTSPDARCPECRKPFSQDDIRVNRVLRNLVNAAKDHLREHQALRERMYKGTTKQTWDFAEQCLHHNEQFKLFCVEDQEVICVICREETKHRGHNFIILKDAFHHKKKKTCEALETFLGREEILIGLIEEQAEEVLKTMEKSRSLSSQISAQFEKLHQFLNDKEMELKRHLEEEENQILDIMGVNMFTMEEMLSDGREKIGVIKSALEINRPTKFLQWWNENGRFVNREIHLRESTCLNVGDLRVTQDTLSLGPYETYLQFFVWKEMLRVIQMVPHHHAVEDKEDPHISISPSKLCIQPKQVQPHKKEKLKPKSVWLKTVSSCNTGNHFWEMDVGKKIDWGIGVCSLESGKIVNDTVLCFNSESGYDIQQAHYVDKGTVDVTPRPRKIGVYLDCEKNQISFYDSDKMTLIDTRVLSKSPPYSLCLSPGLYLDGWNSDPLMLCWY